MAENQRNQGRMRLMQPTHTASARRERARQHEQASVVPPCLTIGRRRPLGVKFHERRDHKVVQPMMRMSQLHPRP